MQTLNGTWKLTSDPNNEGRAGQWFAAVRPDAHPAPVPGIVQQVFPTHQGVAWYWHAFTPARLPETDERCLLRFGAVEYLAEVWLNRHPAGGHEGAETPFELDVTELLRAGENLLAVRVVKPGDARVDGLVLTEIPHRNQFDTAKFQPGMSYNIAGITGRVELLIVPSVHIADILRTGAGTSPLGFRSVIRFTCALSFQVCRGMATAANSSTVGAASRSGKGDRSCDQPRVREPCIEDTNAVAHSPSA